jgi:quercetin dioxygenase-like cupin family protein
MFGFIRGRHREELSEVKRTLNDVSCDIKHARKLLEEEKPFIARTIGTTDAVVFDKFLITKVLNCHMVSVVLVRAQAGDTFPAHGHDEHELIVQLTGSSTYILNKGQNPPIIEKMVAGGFVFVHPGQTHAAEYHEYSIQLVITIPGAKPLPGFPDGPTPRDGSMCEDCECAKLLDLAQERVSYGQ